MIITETPKRQLVSKLVSWGHWFALANIIIAIAISGVYLFSSPMPNTMLGITYLFSNWFSHIGFLTFIGFVIFVLPVCYFLPNSRFVRAYASITAAVALAMLALDALLYTRYGLHLSFNSVEFIKDHAKFAVAEVSGRQWGFFSLSFIAWLFLQLLLANSLWKRIERLQKLKIGIPISAAFTTLFVFSHVTHIWADAELYQPIVQQDDMLPLSYPATAKTLMSKYGLLNLEDYKQRKALQLDINKGAIKYPAEPLYCVVNNNSRKALLVVTDKTNVNNTALAKLNALGLTQLQNHFDLSLSQRSAVKNILYGLPDLYHWKLGQYHPILLDLPAKLGLPVNIYSHQPELLNSSKVPALQDWQSFMALLSANPAGLNIGFITQEQLTNILTMFTTQSSQVPDLLITHLHPNNKVETFTNLAVSAPQQLSQHEDLSATLLASMGCHAKAEHHSTGQNLLNSQRNWLVTTQNDKVVILHQDLQIQLDSRGNYQIYDQDGSPTNMRELNTGLLSQAIKLLGKFADNE